MRRTFPFNHIGGVAISNDGKKVLVGGHKKQETEAFSTFVEVWLPETETVFEDHLTFRELTVGNTRIYGHTITEVGFSPDGDSVVVAVMGEYSPAHSQLLRTTLKDVSEMGTGNSGSLFGPLVQINWNEGTVHKLAFSPNGAYVAATVLGDGGTYWADVSDLKKNEQVGQSEIFSRPIDSISFDAAGTQLGLGVTLPGLTSDGRLAKPGEATVTPAYSEFRLWDFATDTTRTLPYQTKREIMFLKPLNAGSGNGWFVGHSGGVVAIWQPDSVSPYRELNGHRPNEAWDLAFSADGSTLFSVGDDHTLRSWDFASGVEKKIAGPRSILVSCVAVSPDGRWVAAGGYDDDVVVYDAQSLDVVATLKGHAHDVRALAFSCDSQKLASGGRDRNIRIWNIPAFELAGVREGHHDTVRALTWTTDGQLISAGSDRRILTWDSNGMIIHERIDPEGIHCLAFAPAGLKIPEPSTIAAPSGSGSHVDPRSMTAASSENAADQDIITIRSDELLALGMNHGALRLWHLPTDTVFFEAQHHGVQLNSLAFSPDGRTLAVGGSDEAVYLWHVATGRNVLTFDQLGSSVHRLLFSPDGTHLLAALHDGTIRIWHAPVVP